MRKYLGSKMTIYAAIMAPCFIIGPTIFAVIILTSQINFESILLAFGCVTCTIIWGAYMHQVGIQLYSWGTFSDKGIQIKTLISRRYIVDYAKCKSIGIGMYVHGILNSNVGSKVKFIFFSYEPFDEKYRFAINLWRPTKTRVKVVFDRKLYEYLLTVLPENQARHLENDYKKYVQK